MNNDYFSSNEQASMSRNYNGNAQLVKESKTLQNVKPVRCCFSNKPVVSFKNKDNCMQNVVLTSTVRKPVWKKMISELAYVTPDMYRKKRYRDMSEKKKVKVEVHLDPKEERRLKENKDLEKFNNFGKEKGGKMNSLFS